MSSLRRDLRDLTSSAEIFSRFAIDTSFLSESLLLWLVFKNGPLCPTRQGHPVSEFIMDFCAVVNPASIPSRRHVSSKDTRAERFSGCSTDF